MNMIATTNTHLLASSDPDKGMASTSQSLDSKCHRQKLSLCASLSKERAHGARQFSMWGTDTSKAILFANRSGKSDANEDSVTVPDEPLCERSVV